MKPFDLKTWQENPGIKVVTRDGNDVTGLMYYENPTEFKLVGIVGASPYPYTWRESGMYRLYATSEESCDLMFADDPQPKLRPWEPEEVPVVCWVRRLTDNTRKLIIQVNSICVETDLGSIKYTELLEEYEHTTDGKTFLPCGVPE